MSNYSRRLQNVLEQIETVENNLNKNLIEEFSNEERAKPYCESNHSNIII
jgi:hypothetical protein